MTSPMLEIQHLSVRYGSRLRVSDVNIKLYAGQILAVLGPNGAGKTTLLRTIVGFRQPSAGTIKVLGQTSEQLGRHLRSSLAFVQAGLALLSKSTAQQHFDFGRSVQPHWNNDLAQELATEFGFPLDRDVIRLSSGQRAALAATFALASQPKVLLLDEVTNNLDPETRITLLNRLIAFAADGGAIMLATHLLSEAESIADQVAFMRDGQLIRQGNLDQMRESHHHVRFRLKAPASEAQLESVRRNSNVREVEVRDHNLYVKIGGDSQATIALLTDLLEPQDVEVSSVNLETLYLETLKGVTK